MIWSTRSPSDTSTGADARPGVVDLAPTRLLRECRVGLVDEPLHVHLLAQDGETAGVQLCQVEDVADEPLEASRLQRDDRERGRLRVRIRGDALAKCLDVAAYGGERSPQLVRDGEEEVALELVRLLEPGGHRAEALGQVGDLVTAADRRQVHVVAALAQAVGGARQGEHGHRDPPASHHPRAPAITRPPISASDSRWISVSQFARSWETGEAATSAPNVD